MAFVQEVLLYGSETWVVSPRIGRILVSFHHRVASRLTVHRPRKGRYGMWVYPTLAEVMAKSVLYEVYTYVSRR